jgi:hypothetical protein
MHQHKERTTVFSSRVYLRERGTERFMEEIDGKLKEKSLRLRNKT